MGDFKFLLESRRATSVVGRLLRMSQPLVLSAILGSVASAAAQPSPEGEGTKSLQPTPRLTVEPVAEPWEKQATVSYTHPEIFFQGSPLGWAFGDGHNRYVGLARLGLGAYHVTNRTLSGAFAAYELSSLSVATFGLHVMGGLKTGPGLSLGALLETSGRAGFSVGVAMWALGLEYQYRNTRDMGATHVFMLRMTVPILEMYDELTYLRRPE